MENKFPRGVKLPRLRERVDYGVKELGAGPEGGPRLGPEEERVQQLGRRAEAIEHGEQKGRVRLDPSPVELGVEGRAGREGRVGEEVGDDGESVWVGRGRVGCGV